MMEYNLFNTTKQTENTTKNKRYLLQINRIKLTDYVSSGLILPDIYLCDQIEPDIQSKNKEFLAVSDGYINELNEYQILLELIFTEDEKEKFHNVDGLSYFDFPLPLSRIKNIYAYDKNTISHIHINLKNSDNGSLPKELFHVYRNKQRNTFEAKQYLPLPDTIRSENNYEKQITYFNKQMGMYSFMKNTEIYYSGTTNYISNYSNHYFGTLSTLLKEPLEYNRLEQLDILNKNESFKNLLYSNNQIDQEFIYQEAGKIENDELKRIFLQITKPTGIRERLTQLLDNNMLEHYLIALVYHFRQKNGNKKDSIKIDLENLIPTDVAEISLAVLGIYIGYENLRYQEKVEPKDIYYKKIFGEIFILKFSFESKLEYIIVEALYNICFKSKLHKGYEYDYLPYPTKKPESLKIKFLKILSDKKFKTWYELTTKEYFDTERITINKLSVLEMFGKMLGKYSEEIIESKATKYLIPFVQYTFGDILTHNEKGQRYFKKNDLLKKLEASKNNKIDIELIDVLNISVK